MSEHLQDPAVESYGCCGDSGDCMCNRSVAPPEGKPTLTADELLDKLRELGPGWIDIHVDTSDAPWVLVDWYRRGGAAGVARKGATTLAGALQALLDYETAK